MTKLLCVYLILHLHFTNSDSASSKRDCSTTLKAILNIISAQGRNAQPIAQQEQTPVEHMTPQLI